MTIIKTLSTQIKQCSEIKLPRYAQIVEYDECMFFGIQRDGQENYACRTFWSKLQRDSVGRYLCEAEREMEDGLKFKIGKEWISNEHHDFNRTGIIFGNWCHTVAPGVISQTVISEGESVSYALDPAIIGPIPVTIVDEEAVRVTYPDSDIQIFPSNITIESGLMTILIPRCRMLKPEYINNNTNFPYNYNDTSLFLDAVDIYEVNNDSSTQAFIVYKDGSKQSATMSVLDKKLSKFCIRPENGTCYNNNYPVQFEINYLSGVDLDPSFEDIILRLAHSKMPHEPCGCDITQRLWLRDRNIPQTLTKERVECPFGLSDGAWAAYKFVSRKRVVRSIGCMP